MLRRWLLPLVPLVVFASMAAQAGASTLTVNTGADSVSPGPGQCSLREAIQAVDSPGSTEGGCAPAAFGPNTIVLGRGQTTYYLQAPHGALTVTPAVTSLTITGAGEANTVINGSGLDDRILVVQTGASVAISNLTITNGEAGTGASGAAGFASTDGGPGGAGADGGAILNAGTLTLTEAAVTDSAAGAGGAGGSSVSMIPGSPAANGGAGGSGGDGGAIFNTGSLTLKGVTIADNHAGNGGAGGPAGQGAGPAPSTGGTGGAAGSGGDGAGVANDGGALQITDSTIRGNSGGAGGAGGAGGPGWCCVSPSVGGPGGAGGNGSDGGGVWSDGGTLSLTNSTLVSNVAGDARAGGAGAQQDQQAAPGSGGAGGNGGTAGGVGVSPGTSANVLNATIVDNGTGGAGAGGSAGQGTPAAVGGANGNPGAGGGIGTDGAAVVTVQNSLFALNPGGNCGPGTVLDAGHNLSFGDTTCPSTFASGDPKLGPLQDNGGPTQTIGLGAGSAAIDQIPPSGAGCPATDQRGVLRPSGPACDIGAYEVARPELNAATARATGRHTVEISVPVTANAGSARVWVQYGKTRSYGHRSRVQTVAGVVPTSVPIKLTGVNLGSTYHYRVVVTSPDGTSHSRDRKLAVPVITALRLHPPAFSETGPGTVLTYNEARVATTTFAVQRHEGHRWVTLGRFRHRDVRGPNRVSCRERLGGRKLGAGEYRLLATPRSASAAGTTISARFAIT